MILNEFSYGTGRITIARPEKANSLTAEMLSALIAAFEQLAQREDLRAVILTGQGKVFSAGADLDEARAGLAMSDLWERLSARVASMPCLTIAALNGTLAGGAMGMALACDMRLCVPETRIFYPVMRLGFRPPASDPGRLSTLIGPSRAKMILMAGQKISAQEALSWGLVDRIHPAESLLTEAEALTADACKAVTGHVAAIKAMLA
ncbi:enoyl-CoA hydratase/isomerase family protein [Paracoccus sp. MBLB3053]|uniref:Enoyl-CoA hydratase/isomerase family protein n=1 Tax=Paracoccus aurantius TaxID=3073814 RepID=A0ABU2HPD2_9RHOB|nr:enoyl-CoA hydratase/isomerase family protein [Paracoccus sp. MBLB3053]MDS9466904.1 enoyl-CoA hydratase/isomerase family protein [Paracoccus sp. MBLB3053]